MTFVHIHFLHGGAGNFFSRALGLADHCHSHLRSKDNRFLTVDEKFKMFSFKENLKTTWMELERNLPMVNRMLTFEEVLDTYDNNDYIIDAMHPHKKRVPYIELANNDHEHVYLLNDTRHIELWRIANSEFKITRNKCKKTIDNFNRLAAGNTCFLIDVKTFFNPDDFLTTYLAVCRYAGINTDNLHLPEVIQLHKEWLLTILSESEVADFIATNNIDLSNNE